jgi:hypothetical protein
MGFSLITNETVQTWADREAEWERIEPDPVRRRILQRAVEAENDALIGAGRYYVHGVLVDNHRPILYTEQPGYPFSPEMVLGNLQHKELLVYLDVWERHITHVQNDRLREVALGGADTCTRAQVIWQVKPLLRGDQNVFDCTSVDTLMARQNLPMLRARARRDTSSPELCSVSPESKYRGLENQLYRVEVHEVGPQLAAKAPGKSDKAVATATFKWSRDNASVVFPIVSLSGSTVVVDTLGRDACSMLKPGDWVEVCDDLLALREQSGVLAQIEAVDRDELKVTVKWPNDVTVLPGFAEGATPNLHPLLRRWDHAGELSAYHGALPVIESTDWIGLEDGVQIAFSEGGEYRVGDYWLIPARVATGDVEWPARLDPVGIPLRDEPAELPPRGPKHYYAPLYHVRSGNGGAQDCRCKVAPVPCGQGSTS